MTVFLGTSHAVFFRAGITIGLDRGFRRVFFQRPAAGGRAWEALGSDGNCITYAPVVAGRAPLKLGATRTEAGWRSSPVAHRRLRKAIACVAKMATNAISDARPATADEGRGAG